MTIGLDHHVHLLEPPVSSAPGGTTLVLLHGTGADETDLLPLGGHLADDAVRLSPRGNVREGGTPRWFARLGEGVLDVADVARRADELADWLAVAASHHGLDPDRLVAVGFSNGANVAAAILLRRPGVFRAAALFAPMVPLEPDTTVDLTGTDVFVSAGRRDPVYPVTEADRLAGLLDTRGAEVVRSWHDGGHELPRSEADAARDWLADLDLDG